MYIISTLEKNILLKCYFLRVFSKFDKFELWNGIYPFLVELLLYFYNDVGLSGFLYDYFHDNNFKFVKL